MTLNDPHYKQVTRQQQDAQRFTDLDPNVCQMCGAQGEDKRSLFIDCGADVSEAVPEALNIRLVGIETHQRGWYLRVCKACRGRFVQHLRDWRQDCLEMWNVPKDHDGHPTED